LQGVKKIAERQPLSSKASQSRKIRKARNFTTARAR